MKNLITIFFSSLICAMVLSPEGFCQISTDPVGSDSNTTRLVVELVGLDSDEGQAMVGLYDSESTWLSTAYKGEVSKIENGKVVVVFENVPAGTYAASAVHDEDNNGKLNSGVFGIPSEPYACTRGAKGMFGPPKWEDAKFDINGGEAKQIIKF